MSFSLLRTLPLRHCARHSATTSRRYATSTSPDKSNLGLYLGAVGIAGLGAYYYLQLGKPSPKTTEAAAPIAQAQEKSPLDPNNFVDFKLKQVVPYNHNTSKFIFELPDNQASLLPVASCVVVKASNPEALKGDNGKPIIRPYTPISPSNVPGELTFLVKKYPNGKASVHFHELKPGETLSVKGPIPKIPYQINEWDEVGLIGGGSGITPLYQVVTHALADKSNKTRFTLIFSNVTEPDILLREEFDEMKKKFPDTFNVVYVLDKADEKWKGPTGYINTETLQKNLAPPDLGNKVKILVCGPPGQVASIAGKKDGMKQGELGGLLKDMGYSQDQVFKF